MRIAHLILAHKNPEQINKLIDLLNSPGAHFFIHLDKKTKLSAFNSIVQKENIHFISNRIRTDWGTYSLIQATFNSIQEILGKGIFDYINFLSGQDLPLKTGKQIEDFLSENKGNQYITSKPYEPTDIWWKKNEPRLLSYNFQNWKIPGKYKLQNIANFLLPKRKIPENITITGNSQWFCITGDCAQHIINTMIENKNLIRYFKYVWGADEFIFSTIVYNSPFKNKIKENLHHISWSNSQDGHPKFLGVEDFHEITHSGKLFARKFNEGDEVIQMLENWIDANKND